MKYVETGKRSQRHVTLAPLIRDIGYPRFRLSGIFRSAYLGLGGEGGG